MSNAPSRPIITEPIPEPAWDVAHLFPAQGTWSEEEYLALTGNRLVEFSHGIIEVLPMPTTTHQVIVLFLYDLLKAFLANRKLGSVLVAPLRVRLWPGKFREPDLIFMRTEHAERIGEQYWDGADLVMEIVSDDDRRRDLDIKRREYAQAGIPEYWIIDRQQGRILVLTLEGTSYAVLGEFTRGDQATSKLLPGFTVDVDAVFSAAI
ncbi:MAG: Uma2 family endonuclease [Isosphaeraceae bacterium]